MSNSVTRYNWVPRHLDKKGRKEALFKQCNHEHISTTGLPLLSLLTHLLIYLPAILCHSATHPIGILKCTSNTSLFYEEFSLLFKILVSGFCEFDDLYTRQDLPFTTKHFIDYIFQQWIYMSSYCLPSTGNRALTSFKRHK